MKKFSLILTGTVLTALIFIGCGPSEKTFERYFRANTDPVEEESWVFAEPELPLEPEEVEPEEFVAEEAAEEQPTEKISAEDMLSKLDFALKFYRKMAEETQGNMVISPYSIEQAFAMLYWGARTDTAREMAKVFGFSLNDEGKPVISINRQTEMPKITLNVANALWMDKAFPLLPEYVSTLKRDFKGAAYPANFAHRPNAERTKINRWVAYQTRNKIQDLFPEDSINADTVIALVNAIYFYADWLDPFNAEATEEMPFFITPDESKKIPMMRGGKSCSYYEDEGLQVAAIPYENPQVSFLILLPKKNDGNALAELEKSLTPEILDNYLASMQHEEVILTIPKFKVSQKVDLKTTLEKLGMAKSFTNEADFSGITGKSNVFVSSAIHQAVVEVNEKGTEAAAATGLIIAKASLPIKPPVEFRADRPFIFAIHSKSNGILFIGRFAIPE